MSLDLIDLGKLKVDEVTGKWLRHEARLTGKTIPEVARSYLHRIAARRVHEATLLIADLKVPSHAGEYQGNQSELPYSESE